LALGGPKQRAVLAMLVLEANRPLSKDRLMNGIWGDVPPASAAETLDTYISRLRRLLGPDRLARRPAGYVLRVEPGELDLAVFDELVSSAERVLPEDPAAAAAALAQALGLWRGAALADLRLEPFATGAADRLDEKRLAALVRRSEADLAVGLGPALVPELERLVGDHPTRERLVAHLMVALYRAGRQSDALAAMQSCRRHLAQELGLEPDPELRRLEQRILEHDEGLTPAPRLLAPGASSPATRSAERQPSRRKWRWNRAVPAAALVAVALLAGLFSTLGRGASLAAVTEGNVLIAIATRSDIPTAHIELPDPPGAIATAGGAMWVASPSGGAVLQVDQEERVVVDRIPVNGQPGSLVGRGGALWVAGTMGATAERIDPNSGTVTWTTELAETGPVAMAYGEGGLWVADSTDQPLLELSPLSGSVLQRFSLDVHPSSLALADGLVWVAAYNSGTVEGIDPGTGQAVGTVNVGNGPSAIAFGDGELWVANSLDSTVSVVDPATFAVVSTIAVGSGPAALVAGNGSIWVASQYSGTISRISPQRLAVVGTVDVGDNPVALASGLGVVWVAASAAAGDDRGGTLVLVSTAGTDTIDPALYTGMTVLSFLRLEYDTLVTFEPAPGPNGLKLVPDLALQIPVPTEGGRTYTFRLRPGIRYSNGELVRASDFRRELERLFALDSPGADNYSGLIGGQACLAHPETCTLSQGVVTNDATGLVSFHLSAPDPDFLDKLTPHAFGAPVPPGTPESGSPSALLRRGPLRTGRATFTASGSSRPNA
jgi:YVTN family beta-propeller protein